MLKHMSKAGEQTGNVDGMLVKVADFYDDEVDNLVAALTSLMEPLLITFLRRRDRRYRHGDVPADFPTVQRCRRIGRIRRTFMPNMRRYWSEYAETSQWDFWCNPPDAFATSSATCGTTATRSSRAG